MSATKPGTPQKFAIVDCRIHWTFQNLQNNFFQRRREERNVGSVG
jgi:hypothetical protein